LFCIENWWKKNGWRKFASDGKNNKLTVITNIKFAVKTLSAPY